MKECPGASPFSQLIELNCFETLVKMRESENSSKKHGSMWKILQGLLLNLVTKESKKWKKEDTWKYDFFYGKRIDRKCERQSKKAKTKTKEEEKNKHSNTQFLR